MFKLEDYDRDQRRQLKMGNQSGFPINDLDPERFDWQQMEQVRLGRESGKLADIDPRKEA